MTRLIRAAVGNRVLPNLMMLAIVAAGLLSLASITVKIFPDISTGAVNVTVALPGASPGEVVDSIVVPIEDALEGLPEIRKLTATARSGVGSVTAELARGQDVRAALDEIESQVDQITLFPDDAEAPRITEIEPDELSAQLVLSGAVPPDRLKAEAERVRGDLLALPGISQVEILGVPEDQITIAVSPHTLRGYGISLTEFSQRLSGESLDLSAGQIETGGEAIQLRTLGEARTPAALSEIVVFTSEAGAQVRLGDIATVRETFADSPVVSRLDGQPAVFLAVNRVGDQQILDQVERLRGYLDETLRPALPEGVRAVLWRDQAASLQGRIDLLVKNGAIGLALIVFILTLFLDIRIAGWVAAGVAVSFVGSFALMALFGVTINQLSLFGFILALGVVVDDAIVVGEAVYSEQARQDDPRRAAVDAATRMAPPVFFAVFTTIAVFVPLLQLPGASGGFIAPIAAIVIFVLSLSLVESFFILPRHLASVQPGPPRALSPRRLTEPLRNAVGGRIERFADGPLRRIVGFATRRPLFVVALALALLVASAGLLAGGWVKFVFFPQVEGNFVSAEIELPESAEESETLARARVVADAVDAAAARVARDWPVAAGDVVEGTAIAIGFSARPAGPGAAAGGRRNVATVTVKLRDAGARQFDAGDFRRAWAAEVGPVPGVKTLSFSASLVGVGKPVALEVSADSEAGRDRAVARLRAALEERDGVFSIADDRFSSAREIAVRPKPAAQLYGITTRELAGQLRAAFFGTTVTTFQRDREEVEVRVRLAEDARDSLADLGDLQIRTQDGFVPIPALAELEFQQAPTVVSRVGGQSVVTLTADVETAVTTGGAVTDWLMSDIVPGLEEEIAGLTVSLGGEQEEQGRTTPALLRNFGFAMIAIYAILTLAFQSYTRPLLILGIIPFGFIGAVLGHLLLGLNLTLLSVFGLIGLSGILINGGLLINHVIQEKEAAGVAPLDAAVEATVARFRPILLTTLTTFFGVFPLILETSVQARFIVPTAVSLAFGLLSGMLLLQLLMPAYAALYARVRECIRGRSDGRRRADAAA
ncbi:efflux RND transporter permease subunit [Aquibium sp. A9E412]|uniref:efflux RND transporter permease subunit n=1 Tax=Aquibium sp. A9E412 TaxID=2976767 RepID=UPI0025AF87C2|nr:efflux RND transporter permease subunit [Aquibium sp. A9E412]MDN2567829.1 efflux RND transporter permease subunit [Aquibium sp. A9E412]